MTGQPPSPVRCATSLELRAIPGIPIVGPGDDVPTMVGEALDAASVPLVQGDILAITSKVLSRAEGRFVDLGSVTPSSWAQELAGTIDKDPRLVEMILQESVAVSRSAPGVLIVRHRLGFISANAGIDASNAVRPDAPPGSGPWVLLMPTDPDAGAEAIRAHLKARSGVDVGIVITDSHGRPFRLGTVGSAVGVAGLPPLVDQRGRADLFGRPLEHTVTALADQVAAAADLVAGQSDESRPLVLVRGLSFPPSEGGSAAELLRPTAQDLYA